MTMHLVESYKEVLENVRVFNQQKDSGGLQRLLSRFRSWYYVPELGVAGPSKFIGYKGMTADLYLRNNKQLDGKDTEARLPEWFVPLDMHNEDAPGYAVVNNIVDALFQRCGKKKSRLIHYNVPRGWNPGQQPPRDTGPGVPADMAEVYLRAFQSLPEEARRIIARRINGAMG